MAAKLEAQNGGTASVVTEVRETLPPTQRLIESCQGLVRSLAWRIHQRLPPHVDLEDLISFGQVGLVEAARDFDPTRGTRFITYAYYRVRGAIFNGLSELTWFRYHDYYSSRYEYMANELLELDNRDSEQAGTHTAEDDLRWFRNQTSAMAVVYLATQRGRNDDRESEGGGRQIADESAPSPSALAMERELREKLNELIAALPSDAGGLIRAVHFEGLTLQEAGRRLGISKAWASRLHAKTLQRLAHSLRLLGVSD
jgi:RNA polymerase sigma factor for flagellar operon FliA